MDKHIESLFQFTRNDVSDRIISAHVPVDPGLHDYIRILTQIRRSGAVPEKADFDLREAIGLTGWGDPSDYECPGEFIRFHRFTSSIGLILMMGEGELELDSLRQPNYLAHDLISDLDGSSVDYVHRLTSAFSAARSFLLTWDQVNDCSHSQVSYFTVSLIILAQFIEDWPSSERFSALLVHEHFEMDSRYADQLDDEWRKKFSLLRNPTKHADTQLVIDTLNAPKIEQDAADQTPARGDL